MGRRRDDYSAVREEESAGGAERVSLREGKE